MRIELLTTYLSHSHNFVDPVTRGPALIIVNSIFLAIATILFCLRVYTRLTITKSFGWDDLFVALGYVCTVGLTATVILAHERYYWNRHIWDIPLNGPSTLKQMGQVAIAAKFLYSPATVFTRMSLLAFYSRLFSGTGHRVFRTLVYIAIGFNVMILIVFGYLAIWTCTPVSDYWSFTGHCMDEGKSILGGGITSSVADLITTALPIPLVMKLKMPTAQRISVIVLLSLGFLVTIAGGVRTYYGWQAFYASADETWWSYPLWLAATVEVQVSVICACVPTTRVFFARYFPSLGLGSRFGRPSPNDNTDASHSGNSLIDGRGKSTLLSWTSQRTDETPDTYDTEKAEVTFASHPLSGQRSIRKAAEILGDDRIFRDSNGRSPLYIMTEKSIEITRSDPRAGHCNDYELEEA